VLEADKLDRKGGCGKRNEDVDGNVVFRGAIGFDDGAICRAPNARAPGDLPVS